MNEPLSIGLEPMPLHEEIEGGQREGKPRLEGCPGPMGHFLQMTDSVHHRQHGFHQHPGIPKPPIAEFEIRRIALFRMERRITQDDHLVLKGFDQRMESGVRRIGPGTVPGHDQAQFVQEQTEFTPDKPAMVGFPFAANLLCTCLLYTSPSPRDS